LEDLQVLEWEGGIPTSLVNSSQQSDFPNAWPPLQQLFVEALDTTDYQPAKDVAFATAQKWVANTLFQFQLPIQINTANAPVLAVFK